MQASGVGAYGLPANLPREGSNQLAPRSLAAALHTAVRKSSRIPRPPSCWPPVGPPPRDTCRISPIVEDRVSFHCPPRHPPARRPIAATPTTRLQPCPLPQPTSEPLAEDRDGTSTSIVDGSPSERVYDSGGASTHRALAPQMVWPASSEGGRRPSGIPGARRWRFVGRSMFGRRPTTDLPPTRHHRPPQAFRPAGARGLLKRVKPSAKYDPDGLPPRLADPLTPSSRRPAGRGRGSSALVGSSHRPPRDRNGMHRRRQCGRHGDSDQEPDGQRQRWQRRRFRDGSRGLSLGHGPHRFGSEGWVGCAFRLLIPIGEESRG